MIPKRFELMNFLVLMQPSLPGPRGLMMLTASWRRVWLPVSLALIALGWLLVGCQSPQVVVIPEDRAVRYVTPGSTNTEAGYFVPPARMLEILRALNTGAQVPTNNAGSK